MEFFNGINSGFIWFYENWILPLNLFDLGLMSVIFISLIILLLAIPIIILFHNKCF